MSDGWIKMRAGLLANPKLIAMSRRLQECREFRDWLTPGGGAPMNGQIVSDGALRCVTCAALLKVWSVARMTGNFEGDDLILSHITIDDLDQIAEIPGVGQAMESVGWAIEGNGVTLPNFKEYNVPMEARERQKLYRERALRGVAPGAQRAGSKTLRLEKSREEKSIRKSKKNTSSPSGSTSRIDLERERREWLGITEADWQAWSEAYPAVDVRGESLRAMEWCLAAGPKGHKSNYRKFLTNWFSRSQDRGGPSGGLFGGPLQQGPSRVMAPPGKYDNVGTEA